MIEKGERDTLVSGEKYLQESRFVKQSEYAETDV